MSESDDRQTKQKTRAAHNSNRSVDQPISITKRDDLVVVPVWFQDQRWFVVKDPLSLEYCRLRADEWRVLNQLDGQITWTEIKQDYDRQFSPNRVTPEQLQALIYRFHRLGLVISNSIGQADPLFKRARKKRKQFWISQLSSLLFLRFPGVDPDRFLQRIRPWAAWIFTPPWIVCCCLLMFVALASVVANMSTFLHGMPALDQFFTTQSILTTIAVISVTKVLHELGHGIACKHFGGECHQIGPMLLVFAPALYCDTSDSWLLPKKWQRAFVGFAGMYVELILAAVCTFVWWSTQPGWIHYVCIRVMMVSSISTVLFNANPLLRYDGYFILSDLWGVPNLAERSRRMLAGYVSKWVLGVKAIVEPLSIGHQIGFVVYAIASALYRWVVVIGILLFVASALRPLGLSVVTGLYTLSIVAGVLVIPSIGVVRFVRTQDRIGEIHWSRALTAAVVLIGLLTAVSFLPVRHHVHGHAVLQPADSTPVFVTVGGRVEAQGVQAGQIVSQGQLLVQLANEELRFEHVRAEGQRDAQQQLVRDLQLRQTQEPELVAELPTAKATLTDLENQLEQRTKRLNALRVVATKHGRFVSPPTRSPSRYAADHLSQWSNLPISPENQSCFLEGGTQIGSIGDPLFWEAEVVVREGDRDFVRVGQLAMINSVSRPDRTMTGTVVAVSHETVRSVHPMLQAASGGPVATDPGSAGGAKPLFNAYLVRIRVDQTDLEVAHASVRARVKIVVDRASLGYRLYRRILKVLRFL